MQNNNPQTLGKKTHNHSFSFSSDGSFCPWLSLRQGRETVQETLFYSSSIRNTENTSSFYLQGDESCVYRHRLMHLIQSYSQTGTRHFLVSTAVGDSVETDLRVFVCFSADSTAANKIISTLVLGQGTRTRCMAASPPTGYNGNMFFWVQLTHSGDFFLTIMTLKCGKHKH